MTHTQTYPTCMDDLPHLPTHILMGTLNCYCRVLLPCPLLLCPATAVSRYCRVLLLLCLLLPCPATAVSYCLSARVCTSWWDPLLLQPTLNRCCCYRRLRPHTSCRVPSPATSATAPSQVAYCLTAHVLLLPTLTCSCSYPLAGGLLPGRCCAERRPTHAGPTQPAPHLGQLGRPGQQQQGPRGE